MNVNLGRNRMRVKKKENTRKIHNLLLDVASKLLTKDN